MANDEGFYCQHCGAVSRATCDCTVSFLVRRLNERAEYDCVDWEAAWRTAADQAKEYIEKHAEERKARKEADAELARLRAERDGLDCTRREGGDTRHCRVEAKCLRCQNDELRAENERLLRYEQTHIANLDEFREAMSELLLWLGEGPGSPSMTPDEWVAAIKKGLDVHITVNVERAEQAEASRDQRSTMEFIKPSLPVLATMCNLARLSVGESKAREMSAAVDAALAPRTEE